MRTAQSNGVLSGKDDGAPIMVTLTAEEARGAAFALGAVREFLPNLPESAASLMAKVEARINTAILREESR